MCLCCPRPAACRTTPRAGLDLAGWAEAELVPRLRALEAGTEGLASPDASPYLLRKTCLHAALVRFFIFIFTPIRGGDGSAPAALPARRAP